MTEEHICTCHANDYLDPLANKKIISNNDLLHYEIKPKFTEVYKRIHIMRDSLDMILMRYPEIDQIILEEVLPEQKNQHTFKMLIYLQAAIEFLVWEKYPKVKISYILPNSWRSKCGIQTGRGVKREMLKAADIAFVKNTYGLSVNDDEADAIGIGYYMTTVINKNTTVSNWEI